MKELAPPEQFVKDMFRFPRARQSVFRVGDADYQRSAVPAEVDARSGHDVRGRLAGDAAQQQHAVVYQMDAAGAGFLLYVQNASVNAGGPSWRFCLHAPWRPECAPGPSEGGRR